MSKPNLSRRRVAHKSTGGILPAIPAPVDPVGNAPDHLTPNTVPLPDQGEGKRRGVCSFLANAVTRG